MSRNLILIIGILLIWFLVIRGGQKDGSENSGKDLVDMIPSKTDSGKNLVDFVPSRSYTN